MSKPFRAHILFAVVAFFPDSSGASIIFDYVGSNFTESHSVFATTSDRVVGFVELESEPLPGTAGIFDVTSWGFSAGSVEITSAGGATVASPGFFFAFDPLGGVAAWDFWVIEPILPLVEFPLEFLQMLVDSGEITPDEFILLESLPLFPSPAELSMLTDILNTASLTPRAQSLLGQYVSTHVIIGPPLPGDSILSCASATGGTNICGPNARSSDSLLDFSLQSATVNDAPGKLD